MTHKFTDSELEAYLDEALDPADMAVVEQQLREHPELLRRLAALNGRRDAGMHSLGAIWRRHRISCPTREQLGSLLLGTLDESHVQYIEFHIKQVGCRFCQANFADMQRRQAEASEVVDSRRKKYFQSSAGYLRKDD